MFIVNLPIKITVVSIGGLVLLIGSIFFPTYAQPVIKRLSVDDPAGIVLDLKGNVYVIETDNDRILKFNNNGTLITMWGSSGSGPGQFQTPIGIDEDESKQNVYVTDIGNNRVERFTGNGVFVGQWGSLGNGDGQFYNPTGMTVQFPQGHVYVADTGNSRIQEFTNDGKFINKWSINTPTGAVDNIDLDVNSDGTMYWTDCVADQVLTISSTAPRP